MRAQLLLLSVFFLLGKFYHPTVILSASMEPTLRVGALALVQNKNLPAIGDVIYAQLPSGEGYFSHRLIGWWIAENGEVMLTTKGDGQANGDAWDTPLSAVEGVIILSVPYIGKATLYVRRLLEKVFGAFTSPATVKI